jgi:hypothetical protein
MATGHDEEGGYIADFSLVYVASVYVVGAFSLYLIHFLNAIGLSPGGSTHLHTNNARNNTNNN